MTEREFGTLPEGKIFRRLAVPGILSNLSVSVYIIADGIFVGRYIGSDALAAVNLVMPILSILFALSDMVAIGAAVKVSLLLGSQYEGRARRVFSAALALIEGLALFFLTAGLLFVKPLIGHVIHDPALAGLAWRYVFFYLVGFPLVMPLFALDNFLRGCGRARFSMYVNVTTSLLNVVLDWLFIARLGMGIEASSLASVLSMAVGTIWSVSPFLTHQLTLYLTRPSLSRADFIGIFYNGSSEFFSNISGSLLSVVINGLLLKLGGSLAVAGYSVVMYLDSLLIGTLYGVTDSMQPAVSYNVGAGKLHRAHRLFRICCAVTAGVSLFCMALMLLFPRQLAMIFAGERSADLISVTVTALLLFAPSYLFTWYSMVASAFLTALDRPKESLLIMLFRSVLFPLACLALLTPVFRVNGVFLAEPFTAALTSGVAFFLWHRVRKQMIQTGGVHADPCE